MTISEIRTVTPMTEKKRVVAMAQLPPGREICDATCPEVDPLDASRSPVLTSTLPPLPPPQASRRHSSSTSATRTLLPSAKTRCERRCCAISTFESPSSPLSARVNPFLHALQSHHADLDAPYSVYSPPPPLPRVILPFDAIFLGQVRPSETAESEPGSGALLLTVCVNGVVMLLKLVRSIPRPFFA